MSLSGPSQLAHGARGGLRAALRHGGISIGVVAARCYDGDTCTVNIPGDMPSVFSESIPIRILGIDTPEIRGQCAKEKALAIKARDEARKFVVGKKVILSNVQRDKYFRLVADMSTDEGDLATRLLDLNLAVPYDGGTKSSTWC